MDSNPANGETNIYWLKPEQVEAMRDAAHEGRHGPRDEAIVTLLYDTGLRRVECSRVNRDLLDLDAGHLRLPGSIQKDYPNDNSPTATTFELDPEGDLRTVRVLKAWDNNRRDVAALFHSQKSDRLTGKGINDVVKRLARRAGVEPYAQATRGAPTDVSAHTLRHSLAYRYLHVYEGYTMYDVRNRLRHATISTTERKYDHFDVV